MLKVENNGKGFMHRSAESNFFETPYSMTDQFMELEKFKYNSTCIEPACGNGAISKRIRPYFKYLIEGDISHGNDFFENTFKYSYIITNPPYGKEADKFIVHAKKVTKIKFAMLLRTNFLSGTDRFKSGNIKLTLLQRVKGIFIKSWDKGIYTNLKKVYIFTRMSDLRAPIREDGKYPTAGIVYAWLVWEKGYRGKPMIEWIDNQKFVLKKSDLKEK
jgi:hypothetical protein